MRWRAIHRYRRRLLPKATPVARSFHGDDRPPDVIWVAVQIAWVWEGFLARLRLLVRLGFAKHVLLPFKLEIGQHLGYATRGYLPRC